ncbi:hypothetical protein [Candidatus Fonsibacter ubiquis]|uniref:hypothetical protein n=1 Tax=Candidatus Fonsibacter ubiquis TaxID=1925548 RepID=UPI000C08583E|nr:hypothetical protein [Candidatus Fonsibacter ubiquis]
MISKNVIKPSKKIFSNLLIIGLIFVFVYPLIYFGPQDTEEYEIGLRSIKIIWEEKNPFLFFYDFYGPGIRFPIGQGPFFHFVNFFYFDLRTYYIIYIYFQTAIQICYLKKILKKFNIIFNNILLLILIIFSIPHLHYLYSDDFISLFFGYTFFPLVFYYFIKFLNCSNTINVAKLSLFSFIWLINSHPGHLTAFILFLIGYFFLTIRTKEQIFNKSIFLFLLYFALMSAEYIFFLIREKILFDIHWKSFGRPYEIKEFFDIFFINISNWQTSDNRGPGNPVILWYCLIVILAKFYKSIKYFFKNIKNNLSFISKINILFFVFIIISLTEVIVLTRVGSGPNIARDVFFYLSLIIFFYNFNIIKKKIIKYFLILCILFYTFNLFIININYIKNNNLNNFIINKYHSTDLIKTLKNLNIDKKDYSRIYLSPEFFKNRFTFKKDGLFSSVDLIDYNLSPFQGLFKNISLKGFGDQNRLMYGKIESHFKFINNNFFLNFFHIKYLIIFEEELINLKNSDWIYLKKVQLSNGQFLYLLRRNIINLAIKNLDEFRIDFDKCMKELDKEILCLIENQKHFVKSKHEILRINNAKFKIYNLQDKLIVLPFVYDENWKPKNNILNVSNFVMLYKNTNSNELIYYWDNLRFVLKLISIITISILIFFILIYKKNKIKF